MGVLVGRKAPDFKVKAAIKNEIVSDFTLSQYRGKYVLLFFYPLDFTFVCPTELHAFEERLSECASKNCAIIGCSVDSHFSHHAWLQVPKNQGGIQGVTYPLVSDLNKTIARDYDVLVPQDGVAFRALFLIDKEGVVRHQLVNDLPLGRSVDEAIRMLDALQFFEQHGEVCPANWNKGSRGMQATHKGLRDYVAATV
jgi:peroxiredoxin (alkyl hydroperoxide reductase subunit C)